MYQGGDIKLFYLGIVLDVVTLKPEVLTLCLLDEETLETAIGEFTPNQEGDPEKEPFTKEGILDVLTNKYRNRLLGAAEGCLSIAYKRYDFIIEQLKALRSYSL